MTTGGSRWPLALLGALCVVFVLLATANSGGYRYGIGDQAFYEPATQLRLHPELFPRDRELLQSQARLTVIDEALAGASRVTGLELPQLFLALYLITLVTTALAGASLARTLAFSPWATAVFVILLTLRHRIAKTGANTLEGYMHPRQLAFGIGVFALTQSLRNRWIWAAALWLLSAAIHPTTALWFGALIAGGVVLGGLTTVARRLREFFGLLVIAILVGWRFGHSIVDHLPVPASAFMDPDWIAAFADKDYVFVSAWPAYAWVLNLAYLPLIWLIYRRRVATGTNVDHEGRLLAGGLALFTGFTLWVLLSQGHIAFAVQLQASRIFWLLDLVLTAYAAWWLTSDPAVTALTARAPQIALVLVLLGSMGRGIYTVNEAGPDRRLFQVDLPDDDWSRAMRWIKTQPSDWLVLADPDHAWKYGTSVRVAASRDVVLESVKDNSISMYGRDVAMRVVERTSMLAPLTHASTDEVHAIARRYDASVFVAESSHVLQLPKLYTNATFTVYDVR